MFDFIDNLRYKRRLKQRQPLMPAVAARHNQRILEIHKLLSQGHYEACVNLALQWIHSFPVLKRDQTHQQEMAAMSSNALFQHCSTNYDDTKPNKGLSTGEILRIKRHNSYGIPIRYMNGSGVIFLMLAISYSHIGNYEAALQWKSHAAKSGAFYDSTEFGPAEIWRIIELSTINDLKMLKRLDEITYIKSWINADDLSFIYVPRDYVGSHPLGDMLSLMKSSKHYHAFVDYDKGYYRVYTKDDELIRDFTLKGLSEIVLDMINSIRKKPTILDGHFEQYFEELDIP